ncbi:acyltransferase family protein [Luteimonas salinilitoris]|uniref:Acyltransferase family protein n=1 Tax=Luteimonas salinilitoris TaxID=3237697 RepID=A0ABV4HM50_9GAMM
MEALLNSKTPASWISGSARTLDGARLSQTINFARIALIVGLVFLHYHAYPNSRTSPFDGMDVAEHPVATFINSFVLFFFFSVVPLLSMVSGWLFFALPVDNPGAVLNQRIRRRFVSLYLPLVFWNLLFLAILAILYAQSPHHPLLDQVNLRFGSAGWLDYLNAVFGITQHPVGFQFWFVRDLFVTALVSPVLWWVLRHAPLLGMAVLGAAWLAGSGLLIFFRADVAFFFYLGALLRLRGTPLQIDRNVALVLLAVYVALVALRAAAPMFIDFDGARPALLTLATRLMRLVGVLAVWGMFLQIAPTRLGARIASYSGLAFFLHAAHFPLIAQIKIVLWRWVPTPSDAWMVAHYVASVMATVAIAIGVGLLLARGLPRAFALVNGGRLALVGESPAPSLEAASGIGGPVAREARGGESRK